jgi:3-deoxy-7-phosphoheptulonate synthase
VDLVTPVTKAAVAAGVDAIMVEVHPDPAKAWSDGAQSLSLDRFANMMKEVRPVAEAVGRSL